MWTERSNEPTLSLDLCWTYIINQHVLTRSNCAFPPIRPLNPVRNFYVHGLTQALDTRLEAFTYDCGSAANDESVVAVGVVGPRRPQASEQSDKNSRNF